MPEKEKNDLLPHNLELIRNLLDKQKLVKTMVDHQEQPRSELVTTLLEKQQSAELVSRLARIHTADIAHILEVLPLNDRLLVWKHLGPGRSAEVLLEVSEPVREHLIANVAEPDLIRIVDHMDADDLAYLDDFLPEQVLTERLKALTLEDRDWLTSAKTYAEGTVGDLMSSEMVTVHESETLAVVQLHLRKLKELPPHNDKLFVLDARGVMSGVLSLKSILMNDPENTVSDVMAREVVRFHPEDSAVEAASAFERYDLISAPVLNGRGKILGRLTADIIMDFIREQSTDDVLNMAGVEEEEDLFAPVTASARNRGTWLFINLFTAFVAASVIGMFENTIAQLVSLAALMPIVASVGGNTGNQTTAIMIRGMALGQISSGNLMRLFVKEVRVGLLNGTLMGVVVGMVVLAFYHDVQLAMVIAGAMLITLLFAAILGFAVPLLLEKGGRDPALGSSVLLSATTDSLAFFIFLGMATVFLL